MELRLVGIRKNCSEKEGKEKWLDWTAHKNKWTEQIDKTKLQVIIVSRLIFSFRNMFFFQAAREGLATEHWYRIDGFLTSTYVVPTYVYLQIHMTIAELTWNLSTPFCSHCNQQWQGFFCVQMPPLISILQDQSRLQSATYVPMCTWKWRENQFLPSSLFFLS